MKRIVFMWAVCLLVIACSQGENSPAPDPADPVTVETRLDSEANSNRFPSAAFCVVNNESIVWEHYFGNANIELNIPAERNTIFNVASVSKLVTATAVLQLVERELLDLDADVNDYLPYTVRHPDFPDVPITSRMLLTHRSGMSSPFDRDDPQFFLPFENESAPDLGTWLESYLTQSVAWRDFSPDSDEMYSNHGAALLGFIVESISKTDFAEYCKTNIFEPLEMDNTSFDLDDIDKDLLAIPYDVDAHFHYSVPYYPATSLKTSVEDFSKFILMYLNNGTHEGQTILTNTSVEQALQFQNSGSSLGFIWWNYDGGWKGHAGAYYGSTAFVDLNPALGLGTIVFTNRSQWLLNDPGMIWPGGSIYDIMHDHANSLR